MSTTTIRTKLLPSRETPEAIYIQHTRDKLKFLFLPKSEIISQRKVEKLTWDIEIPDWLAEKHRL